MLSALALGLLAVSASVQATDDLAKINLTSRKINPSGRQSTSAAHNLKRGYSSTNVPLTDFFKGTDLQWFGNISVGTPPQVLLVVFDTGSFTFEIASTQCGNACSNQVQFNTTKSSTYEDGGHTTSLSFSTGVGVDPVVRDDYKLTLRNGSDVVSIGGLNAGQVSLFTITDQTRKFDIDPFSGIQGISTQAQGIFAAFIEQGLPPLFSLYLTPQAVGNAEITIGGIDYSKFHSNLIYSSLAQDSDFEGLWQLASSQICINGRTSSVLQTSRTVIFDSGTSNVLFDTQTTEAIYSVISPNIKPYADEPGAYGIACSQISSLAAIIDISFTSTDGLPFVLTIPSSELNVGPFTNDPTTCQTLINAFDGLNIVGGSLLKHYYSVFDIGQQRMGFAANAAQ